MSEQARFEQRPTGRVRMSEGWFVLNTREAEWEHAPGRSANCDFEGDIAFPQIGINVTVLEPGQSTGMYHWEADQEDFLILSGEALLLIEGEERRLGAWDFVHCPPGAAHTLLGAGEGPCVLVGVGARQHQAGEGWGAYPVEATAHRHGVGVAETTADPARAYAGLPRRRPARYDPSWLPDPA